MKFKEVVERVIKAVKIVNEGNFEGGDFCLKCMRPVYSKKNGLCSCFPKKMSEMYKKICVQFDKRNYSLEEEHQQIVEESEKFCPFYINQCMESHEVDTILNYLLFVAKENETRERNKKN